MPFEISLEGPCYFSAKTSIPLYFSWKPILQSHRFFCMMTAMSLNERDYTPAALFRSPHLMTIVPRFWPRGELLAGVPTESRLFTTEPHTQLLGFCHWQLIRTACQTLVLVHGLEGSSESHYMHGIAAKAYRAGFNVIRMNQRTCGGTEHLSPTLYNTGLSQDYPSHRP